LDSIVLKVEIISTYISVSPKILDNMWRIMIWMCQRVVWKSLMSSFLYLQISIRK
jgi:hypothetical protein